MFSTQFDGSYDKQKKKILVENVRIRIHYADGMSDWLSRPYSSVDPCHVLSVKIIHQISAHHEFLKTILCVCVFFLVRQFIYSSRADFLFAWNKIKFTDGDGDYIVCSMKIGIRPFVRFSASTYSILSYYYYS